MHGLITTINPIAAVHLSPVGTEIGYQNCEAS